MSDHKHVRRFRSTAHPDPGRRRTVLGLAASTAAWLIPGMLRAQAAGECAPTPDWGEGPFYFDPDQVRSDITGGVDGVPLELTVEVLREDGCTPLADARFDLWHADALGRYSGHANRRGAEPSLADAAFLRGTQFTDPQGRATFRTIYPGWYISRTPHIHFKVFPGEGEVVASQLFLPDEINNEVFTAFEPYKSRANERTIFNSNDMFLRDGSRAVFCDVERRGEGYAAAATVAVSDSLKNAST